MPPRRHHGGGHRHRPHHRRHHGGGPGFYPGYYPGYSPYPDDWWGAERIYLVEETDEEKAAKKKAEKKAAKAVGLGDLEPGTQKLLLYGGLAVAVLYFMGRSAR
jgi:hypothetical protein